MHLVQHVLQSHRFLVDSLVDDLSINVGEASMSPTIIVSLSISPFTTASSFNAGSWVAASGTQKLGHYLHLLKQPGQNSTDWGLTAEMYSLGAGGWASEIEVSLGLVSPEASPLGLQTAISPLRPHLIFLCARIPGVFTSSSRDTRHLEFKPHPIGLFNLIASLETLNPKMVIFRGTGDGISTHELWGTSSAHKIHYLYQVEWWSPQRHVCKLISGNCECDLIWREDLCR